MILPTPQTVLEKDGTSASLGPGWSSGSGSIEQGWGFAMGIDHPLLLCWGCLASLLVAPTSHPNPAFPLGAKQASGFAIVCTFVQPSEG